jgi:hypothetical protein
MKIRTTCRISTAMLSLRFSITTASTGKGMKWMTYILVFCIRSAVENRKLTGKLQISWLLGWSGTESTITVATAGLLYQPGMMMDDNDYECGAIGGMSDRENRSTRRKPAPVPLCPPQIPHDLTRARTPDHRNGKQATNRLSYGTAFMYIKHRNKKLKFTLLAYSYLSLS